jgi:hypothetical protein
MKMVRKAKSRILLSKGFVGENYKMRAKVRMTMEKTIRR